MKERYILDAFLPCLSLNLVSDLPQSGHQEASLPTLMALSQLLHHLYSNSFLIFLILRDLYPSQKNNMAPTNATTPESKQKSPIKKQSVLSYALAIFLLAKI
ncbi:hypothetical protein [Campylobacter concisus]